jgi:hypothetical protein
MSMRDNAHDPLDALIADTARAMTEGESTVDLRTAVRNRIAQSQTGWRFPVWRAVAATGGAALVAVTLFLGRSGRAPVEDGGGIQAEQAQVSATTVTAPSMARAIQPAAATPSPVRARTAPRRLVLAAEGDVAEDIEPLIDPITIEPIATIQIAIDVSSGVMPIDIEPLRIEPLRGQ